jgi:hypothetical protein
MHKANEDAQKGKIVLFGCANMAIESEMPADAAAAGLRLREVEIGVRYDVAGSSEHPVTHGVRVLGKWLFSLRFIMDEIINTEQECTLICLNTLYPSRSKNWKKEFI